MYEVDHLKTPTWPKNGGCTADEASHWPEFGSDALAFLCAHEDLLRSTQVPQTVPHAPQVFDDDEPVTREWQIYQALHSGIYRPVNFAAKTLGLGVVWACSAGEVNAQPVVTFSQTICGPVL